MFSNSSQLPTIIDEYIRPWKMATFSMGIFFLLAGSVVTPMPDWDFGVSLAMAVPTYLCSGWCVRQIVFRRWANLPWVLFLAWFCIDGSYAFYWGYFDVEVLKAMRLYSFPLSTCLFLLCGAIWAFNDSLENIYRDMNKCRVSMFH